MASCPSTNPSESITTSKSKSRKQPVVEVVHHTRQPSGAELYEDSGLDATFEEAVQALVKPVKVRSAP